MLRHLSYVLLALLVAGAFFVPGLQSSLTRGILVVYRYAMNFFMACLLTVGLAATAHADVAAPSQSLDVAAAAPGNAKTPVTAANLPVYLDEDLATKHAHFTDFAKSKVSSLNRNHVLSKSRMEIVRQPDGTYLARYHAIDAGSLVCKVRRSKSKSIPFVGVLSYKEKVYEAVANSPEACRTAVFSAVNIIPNRHIFSFKKGGWQ